ncbi:MAG: hypothetical protein Q8Q46_01150 [Candidatus Giovannonibacteria bacterium]|nr:hypothetical protein [Candidatus Giovannonibacteria bacterium]
MKAHYTPEFRDALEKFPEEIRKKLYQKVKYLLNDIRHPSLRTKKYGGAENIWQARVDINIRFYFKIEGEYYILLNITKHPK